MTNKHKVLLTKIKDNLPRILCIGPLFLIDELIERMIDGLKWVQNLNRSFADYIGDRFFGDSNGTV